MMILVLPVASAYAEPFAIATNKDIYAPDDKVIVVGVVPDDAPSGYAVLIKVTDSAGGECAAINVIPGPDNLFISRPVALDCGPGQYSVSAYYADMKANSTFKVSNSSRSDSGSRLELRMIKQVLLQAQDAVNLRLKELIEGGYVLPQEVAEKYSSGVSEASLALQAVELGNTADAKKYQIVAIRHFREVMNALAGEQASAYMNSDEKVAAEDNSRVLERLERLQEFYLRLKDLAEKNGVSMDREFQTVASMLSQSRQMIDASDTDGAEQTLEQVNNLLENIRADLYDDESDKREETLASPANNTSAQKDDEQARRLGDVADRYEKRAASLQSEDNSPEAAKKIQQAVSLIADAKADIEQGDYDSARKALSEAYKALSEARRLIESQDDGSSSRGNSSGSGNDDDDNESSGRGSGNGTSGSG